MWVSWWKKWNWKWLFPHSIWASHLNIILSALQITNSAYFLEIWWREKPNNFQIIYTHISLSMAHLKPHSISQSTQRRIVKRFVNNKFVKVLKAALLRNFFGLDWTDRLRTHISSTILLVRFKPATY